MKIVLKFVLVLALLYGLSYYFTYQISKRVNKEVSSLIGLRLIIDPGHGGKDNGASRENVFEDEINLHIASYLYELSINELTSTYMTRTGDYDLASIYASNRKQEDLRKRVELINSFEADIFVSVHINAIKNESVKGPMVYYRKNDDTSKSLADNIAKELNELSGLNKMIHEEDYYLFKNTTKPGVLVECGFISNDEERKKLLEEDYQKALAESIFQGILSFHKQEKIRV